MAKNIYGPPMVKNLMALPWPKIFMALQWPKISKALPWPKMHKVPFLKMETKVKPRSVSMQLCSRLKMDPLTLSLIFITTIRTPFLKAKNVFLTSFFHKILTLCTISIQKLFIIKSGLWWHLYGKLFCVMGKKFKFSDQD